MTAYRCPSCDGGFPEPDDDQCPWCGEAMDGKQTSDLGLATPAEATIGLTPQARDDLLADDGEIPPFGPEDIDISPRDRGTDLRGDLR